MTGQGSLPRLLAMATAVVLTGPLQAVRAETPSPQGTAGAKGAQVYCFMRSRGNTHQVSWDAAYAVMKRQSFKMFKTSPSHASVMITETVVQNPDAYPECSRYLGDLYRKPDPQPSGSPATPMPTARPATT